MTAITLNGAALTVDDAHAPFWDAMASGRWEATTFRTFDRFLKPEATFLDIGAWIGPTALYAATRCRRVIAFEADPTAAATFRANVAANPALAPLITLHERAVAPAEGTVRMGARNAQGDSMSSLLLGDADVTWTVETITPAVIAAMLDPGEPAFVKIDIEGGEYGLAEALAPLAQRPNTAVLLSFHPRVAAGRHFRWHRTFPLTRRLLLAFRGAAVWKVGRRHVFRSWPVEALVAAGAGWFEAKGSYLFVRP